MVSDYTVFLWLLKLGAVVNLYFLVTTPSLAVTNADAWIIVPARILFAVSAYRCLFPVRYEHNIVFHEGVLSSVFVTRLLATFSEIAYIFQFAYVLRLLNVDRTGWVDALSWLMVLQVVLCQVLVWVAILSERFDFYYYEELGWALIFAANTIATAYLFLSVAAVGGRAILLRVNLLFGAVYLPWQLVHLRTLRLQARTAAAGTETKLPLAPKQLVDGLRRAIRVKNRRTDAESWGGLVGLTWMTGYWATLIPMWVYYIVGVLATN